MMIGVGVAVIVHADEDDVDLDVVVGELDFVGVGAPGPVANSPNRAAIAPTG